ncbi:polyprenyl synthetase family protein [Streptococcus halotolerans]|uniref:polyprenyl synthetase family protein n=1 Tax=Streptococcus halotolerans TaxID=1814128 RepID=UPI0007880667|nr:polyprenyl synthetase family protein [Streptococcus halotolerans]
MSTQWKQYPDLNNNLNKTRLLIEQSIQVRNDDIRSALETLTKSGGKYLRPAFFFLFTSFGPENPKTNHSLIEIAASLEILHMATLIHDDIIDDSPLRRGTVTIQSQFGKDVAVYTGDFLFTVFFDLVLRNMNGSPYMAVNAKTMKKILVGELDQMQLRYHQDQKVRDYLRAVSGKTAALFQLACREGAYFSEANKDIIRLAGHIGHNIGMAFQILDDILDYSADKEKFNKPVLEDLTTGVYSLPLLLAMETNPAAFQELLNKKENITQVDIKTVSSLVRENQGIDKAKALAQRFTNKALEDIQKLPRNKERNILSRLTKELLKRSI